MYRFWRGGQVVYVGVTRQRPAQRFLEHMQRRGRSWWRSLDRVEVASFSDERAAQAEEKAQIAALQPALNKRGVPANLPRRQYLRYG